ncbi:hypothetical protein C818_02417 [Lachnospiraceae bacterium MD308]|nr:hypothetical protein C818_02417 [Lachnospiraceae bacterium MD308]
MKKEKISLGQKIFSCTVYLLSIFLTFFPWIAVGGKRYHIFEVAVALKRTGLKELAVDDSLFASNMAALKAGIWAECGLFFLLCVFAVLHMAAVLRDKRRLWNVFALLTSVALSMWNTSGDTVSALNSGNTLMWCFPTVFILLCGVEFIAGKAMEQWKEMKQESAALRAKEKAQKEEERERLAFEGRYNPLFYQFLWKNLKKTWRDYVLLVFCSSLVFFFIVVGFGMRSLLKEENNIEGIVQVMGSLGSILLNVMFPLAVVSVIMIIILSFYYLRCRAKNYGIFLTLGMRKRTLQFFVALEFLSVLGFTVLIGGIFGALALHVFTWKSKLLLGVELRMGAFGALPYVQAFLALLVLYLVAFMAARDIFVSFRLGSSVDLQSVKEKMPARHRKIFLGAGVGLMLYSMFEYRQLRNFEKPLLLFLFFIGLYLSFRYGIAEYLLRERRAPSYLRRLMMHNQLFHKSKTNAVYVTAMSVLLFCALFYFPFQFISVLIAEDEDTLYPYDIVCMANEEDRDIFGKLNEEYGAEVESYPMVRVANLDSTEKVEGVMEPAPPQGQQIGISESTYRALKKRADSTWEEEPAGLDSAGEKVYIVHQQDKSVKAQPVDYWLSRKKPALHVGVPVYGGVAPNVACRGENPVYSFKEIEGEEIGSLVGVFGQGKWDNLIVFSDEYFETAQDLWKVTDPYTGNYMSEEEVGERGYSEEDLPQGPSELVLVRADERELPGIEKELDVFRERHAGDERYNKAVQSCYIKKNAVQKLRTERIMKSVMNGLMFFLFVLIYFVLLIVKVLMERESVLRRSEFLMCMGMREKDRKRLIRSELFRYFYVLPGLTAAAGAAVFTVLVFQARQYQAEDMVRYLRLVLPLWAACLAVTGGCVGAGLLGYARRVERG